MKRTKYFLLKQGDLWILSRTMLEAKNQPKANAIS